jgi:formamidopyrimidine-DNA glycosylase
MPELPDLEVIREVLNRHLPGRRIEAVEVRRPIVLRVLDAKDTAESFLCGAKLGEVSRRGKFLLFPVVDTGWIAVNCMLAGRLRYCPPNERIQARDCLLLHLDGAMDLRYHDARTMGKVYLTRDLDTVPGYAGMGPDPLDPALTPELFLERLRRYPGEIKGILAREAFVSGIGNAYADEILFRAGIYPFRKRPGLSRQEQLALYDAMRAVLQEATAVLRERMGDEIHREVRDFLLIHNRKGEPCPRCGHTISEVRLNQRATHFCRHCQPGSLIRN